MAEPRLIEMIDNFMLETGYDTDQVEAIFNIGVATLNQTFVLQQHLQPFMKEFEAKANQANRKRSKK